MPNIPDWQNELEITFPGNWFFKIDRNFISINDPNQNLSRNHTPINPINFDEIFTSDIIAVAILINVGKPYWSYGGQITQQLPGQGIANGDTSSVGLIGKSEKLKIQKINLINIPTYANSYTLIYYPPRWFKDVTIKVWEYLDG